VVEKRIEQHLRRLLRLCALLSVAVVTGAFLWSCSPDSGLNAISDYDVVVTTYVPGADYGGIRTYVVPDTVALIIDPDDAYPDTIGRDLEVLILSKVAEQLDLLGYEAGPDTGSTPPDILVPVAVTTTEYSGTYWEYYPGWGHYYPWWGWGGWGYWYPYPVSYTYSTGTIFIDMLDLRNADPEEELVPVVWNEAFNGLLGDTPHGRDERIVAGIEQAFTQSPYLGAK